MEASGRDARLAASSRAQAESWSLVLAAEGIPHGLVASEGAFWVAIDESDRVRAEALLASWVRENAKPQPSPPSLQPDEPTNAGIWIGLALAAFFLFTGPWSETSSYFERGTADARRIVHGEFWRAVTALTLHSDAAHVLGNAFSCGIFGTLLLRRFGLGVGVWILLGSGTLGNLLTAYWHGSQHHSVGASTALFGAIGALAATEFVRRRRQQLGWNRAWLPIAGGLGLLAMLGTGAGSDLMAHVLGLVAGSALGFLAARGMSIRPPAPAQAALAFCALAVVALAWAVALG